MASRSTKPCPPDKHGTASAYTYYRCRCDACKTFWASYRAVRRREGKDRPAATGLVREAWLASVRGPDWVDVLTRQAIRRHRAVVSRDRVALGAPLSLDGPIRRIGARSLASSWDRDIGGDPFSDPTFDAVCAQIDQEYEELRREVWEWNQAHASPRIRVDDCDPVAVPSQLSGMRFSMSPRHRGRNSRSASARGKRSSRSQPKAKV